ncbi:pRL2-19 [Streptomyces sp. NPDC060005]|uniref:pRL2-19 n=1 Tax=Streptomyces sp. NPDC060005 TaxID=3347034 RepID=UPI0036738672
MIEPRDLSHINPADMSHAMLVALLMYHGGSLELPVSAFEVDALGAGDGSWHAVAMEPLGDDKIRLSVRPRPDVPGPGVRIE